MTPWLVQNLGVPVVDEWTFVTVQDRNTAASALRNHWDTFITQDDFRQIAAAGLNHVRLPIGAFHGVVSMQ
jgi:glucan 1,3-beta-glucosidase